MSPPFEALYGTVWARKVECRPIIHSLGRVAVGGSDLVAVRNRVSVIFSHHWSVRRWLLLRDHLLFDAGGEIQLFDDAPQLIDRGLRSLTLIKDVLDLTKSEALGGVVGLLQCPSHTFFSENRVEADHSAIIR
jgi:hypothetical protein